MVDDPTEALSIRQPWAHAILYLGKDVENRDWNDRYPGLAAARQYLASGRPFYLHAAKGMTHDEYEDFIDTARSVAKARPFPPGTRAPAFNALQRGGIVGQARLAAIVRTSPSPWFCGPLGLVLKDVMPMSFRPCRGSLGFFRPDWTEPEAPAPRQGGLPFA